MIHSELEKHTFRLYDSSGTSMIHSELEKPTFRLYDSSGTA